MIGSLASRIRSGVALVRADRGRIAFLGAEVAALVAVYPALRDLLLRIVDHSPFLWGLATRDPIRLHRILSSDANEDFALLVRETETAIASTVDDATVRKILRRTRAHVALLVAIADLGGVWDLNEVTNTLSQAADLFVRCALAHALAQARAQGRLAPDAAIDDGCGLVILAMGKHGSRELNYSSDVDLIAFFDPTRGRLKEGSEPGPFYVKLTQTLARTLSDRTEDGYVARVDLRLRPDPGSTPVAISVAAALAYYETLGQNWERAAMIKARPIAGAIAVGDALLRELLPFIWRRYFDYAAIADIHAMKRQIHAVHGFEQLIVPGHDVKLGRGGIREIEFFVQTQQLIFGGRRPEMRGRQTLPMLDALAAGGWVTDEARHELTEAYVALRTVEHRLQMIADEQTQRLPSDPQALDALANFCGFEGADHFGEWIEGHLRAVERHYARLFEHAPGLDASAGDLVFTGAEDDPATIETLSALGYKTPAIVIETIRGWHFGHRPAVRSARAREILTELLPALLQSFAKCGDPDSAILAFDAALSRMPAATELFSILRSSAALRVLFGDILGAAPRLSAMVTATPHVLDTIVDPRSFRLRYDEATFADDIEALSALEHTEEFLDRCRLVARENQFIIGVRILSRTIEPRDAGVAYSGLAGALVQAALAHVRHVLARDHGMIASLRIAVLALGKLGSREMTASSDLDLILVYDVADDAQRSDGPRPLLPSQYAARIAQRLIAALTAPTREGRLYETDMRLRPWGTQGPLAVRIGAFETYHRTEAETWERMALCRARPIAGDETLCDELSECICRLIEQPSSAKLAGDIVTMRETVAEAKGSDVTDLKLMRGGLLDIEFVAQYLVLKHAQTHPGIVQTGTADAIASASARGVIDPENATNLTAAHQLFSDVLQVQRLALPAGTTPQEASATVRHLWATSAGFPEVSALDAAIMEAAAIVRVDFAAILGG